MKVVPLDRFLHFLDDQDLHSFKKGAVEGFFSEFEIDPDDLLSFVFFREDKYARNLVHRNEHCELLILTWLPGQVTSIHDHGDKQCWISVHTGQLTFKTYGPIVDESKLPAAIGSAHVQEVGSPLYIDDGIGIHSIANASKKPAVSMHLYAGPMQRCRVYDERVKRFVWKDLNYFTQYGRQARTHILALD